MTHARTGRIRFQFAWHTPTIWYKFLESLSWSLDKTALTAGPNAASNLCHSVMSSSYHQHGQRQDCLVLSVVWAELAKSRLFSVVLTTLRNWAKQFRNFLSRTSWLVANSVHTADTDKTRQESLVPVGGVNWTSLFTLFILLWLYRNRRLHTNWVMSKNKVAPFMEYSVLKSCCSNTSGGLAYLVATLIRSMKLLYAGPG